jgi:hypothetical protein
VGTHRISVRDQQRSYARGLRELQREVGVTIVWYEFDHDDTTMDDTYDEGQVPDVLDPGLNTDNSGPGLVYRNPLQVPVVWLRFEAPTNVQSESGEYTVSTVSFRMTAQTSRRVGLQNPMDPSKHFNDRFVHQGFLYRVDSYTPKGWISDQYFMVDVLGTEVKTEELADEKLPGTSPFDALAGTPSTPWTPGQALDWPETQPSDWSITQDTDQGPA